METSAASLGGKLTWNWFIINLRQSTSGWSSTIFDCIIDRSKESIESIRKMLPHLIVPEAHKPKSNRYLLELTRFCLYNAEDSIKLGLAIKTIVEWKTSEKDINSKEAYDRVVFVLDDLHLFDYESLTVLSAIVQANIPKLRQDDFAPAKLALFLSLRLGGCFLPLSDSW